jgi:hypothetical protein
MSTKTNFKRIALVAVAALGLGVLSSVPSQAAVSGLTLTVTDGTPTLASSDSTTAALINVNGLMETSDSYTIQIVQKSVPAGWSGKVVAFNFDSSTPVQAASQTIIDTQAAGTAAPTAGSTYSSANRSVNFLKLSGTTLHGTVNLNDTAVVVGADNTQIRVTHVGASAAIVSQNFGIQLDTATTRLAGTYTFTVLVKAYNKASVNQNNLIAGATPDVTLTKDVSLTVAAAASASTVATATYGFGFISNTSTSKNAGIALRDDSTISVVATAASNVGYIYVGVRNAANASSVAVESLTATVTGVGQVCTDGGTTCGTSMTVAATGDYEFGLRGSGVAGTSTIKITSLVTGATYTKSLTYYAKAAKTITAAAYNPVLKIGTNGTAVAATAVDATGTVWGGAAYIVASSAADALIGGSATTPVACTYSATLKTHFCPVSTLKEGTAKFKVIDAATVALATATSNEVSVTVSSQPAATVKLAFNKASYGAFEKAIITVTVLDAAGKTLQGQEFTNLFASGGISSSSAFSSGSDTLTAIAVTTDGATDAATPTTAGAKTYTVYMPATGTVKITATGGTSLLQEGRVEVSASATVNDSGAAALAAVNALATTVASLKTLITTLTNLVLKIQKKVKA